MLDYKNAARIIDNLLQDGNIDSSPSKETMAYRRKKFLKQYSPEILDRLHGYDIWDKLWNTSENGMINALRNNEEYRPFGSAQSQDIKGLPMAYTKRDGWISFYEPKKRLSQEKALRYGEKFRNKLTACVKRISSLPLETVEDYEQLGEYLKKELDDREEHLWLHKYLHMIYPEYFSQFHTSEWKRNVLCLLGIMPRDSYYGMEGQLALINSYTESKDFHDFAVAIYNNFEGIGEDKVCLITPNEERIDQIRQWDPDSLIDVSTDWFEELYSNKYYQLKTPSGNYRKKNHLFVVERDSIVYGVIHSLADKKTSANTTHRVGTWKACFNSTDKLPIPKRKPKGTEREVLDYSQLIFIYRHYFHIAPEKNKIELMIEKHVDDYNRDYSQIKELRDSFIRQFPISETAISAAFAKNGITDFSDRLLQEFDGADAMMLSDSEGLKEDNDIYFNVMMLILRGSEEDEGSINPQIALRIKALYYPEKNIGIDDLTLIDLILNELSLPIIDEQSPTQKFQVIRNWITDKCAFAKNDPYQANYIFIRAAFDALDIPFHKLALNKKYHTMNPVPKQCAEEYRKLDEEDQNLACAETELPDTFKYKGEASLPEYYEKDTPGQTRVIKRNPKKRLNALVHAGYKCEINPDHKSFISKRTGKPYMETHHLVTLEQSDNFTYSLDVEENLVCLCSNCHNEIHYGKDNHKLVRQLFLQRKKLLTKVRIDISEEELLTCYQD